MDSKYIYGPRITHLHYITQKYHGRQDTVSEIVLAAYALGRPRRYRPWPSGLRLCLHHIRSRP